MPRFKEKGFIHLFPLLILLAGIIAGVWLVQQRTNILPKASESKPTVSAGMPDISSCAKLDVPPRDDGAKITLSGTVFEDLNRNSIKDANEVNVKNMPILVYLLYKLDNENPDATPRPNFPTDPNEYYSIIQTATNAAGNWSAEFFKPQGTIEDLGAAPGIFTPEQYSEWLWFRKGELVNEPITIYDSTNYTNIDFPVIGTQSISGKVRSAFGSPVPPSGTLILLDASKASNATRPLYFAEVKIGGTYEFKNLPPLSEYRVKASVVCPWKVVTNPYHGLTLGSAGLANYDFEVSYDENDSCVTQ